MLMETDTSAGYTCSLLQPMHASLCIQLVAPAAPAAKVTPLAAIGTPPAASAIRCARPWVMPISNSRQVLLQNWGVS